MMRSPAFRASFDAFQGELVVDNFAGGGGASSGIEEALGRPVNIAINHSPAAIAMHSANHPETRHFCEDIYQVDPRAAASGRPVGLAWFSPDCTHFSKAKGTQPLKKEIRGLAWVVIRWAREVQPRVIMLENVEEFQTWGPLGADGRPDPDHVGDTFREWCQALRGCGYVLSFKSIIAADHGTPTTRKRLFMIARRDGGPLVWPEPSHGKGTASAWRPASDIIDWSIACPSIFERARPLADKTLARIARGIQRFVVDAEEPFIVGSFAAFVGPTTHAGDLRVHDILEPLRTVTAANRGEIALFGATLVQTGYGERPGQAPRVPHLEKPLGTVVNGQKHGLVAAYLAKHYGGHESTAGGSDLRSPTSTITCRDHHSLVAAFLTKFYGTSTGSSLRDPCPTVTAAAEHIGLVTVRGEHYRIVDIGMRMLQPRELFSAQGFRADYNIDPLLHGKPLTKSQQVELAGNSVAVQPARELVLSVGRSGSSRAA